MNIYEGNENYIFVSYAHADAGIVLPILEALDKAEFRIWFDSGIETGSEWPAYIADHIKNCNKMIYFVTKRSVDSRNCRNEVNFALSQNKDIVVAYLDNSELTNGLDLQLSTNQSVYRNKFANNNDFYNAIICANILSPCKKSEVIENKNAKDTKYIKKSKASKWLVITFTILAPILGVITGLIVMSIIPLKIGQWLLGSVIALTIIAVSIIIVVLLGYHIPVFIINSIVTICCVIYLFIHPHTNDICWGVLCGLIGAGSSVVALILATQSLINELNK